MKDTDIERCIKLIDDQSLKKQLQEATEEAYKHGVINLGHLSFNGNRSFTHFNQAFGAPTLIVHSKSGPEMFFGADRFPVIAVVMNEEWKGPRPGY